MFKGQEGCFIASIIFAKNDSECLLLDHFHLSGLVLGQTTGEDRCVKEIPLTGCKELINPTVALDNDFSQEELSYWTL